MHIKLANPRGFCAGVDRAIEIVNRALEVFGPPIYVRHEVVHNKFVVEDLRARGAVFVEELDQVPDNVIVIFSAHGVSQAVRQEAERRGLKVFDATCPLVTKVHKEVDRLNEQGYQIIMIGHKGHPEVEGTMGQLPEGVMLLVETVAGCALLFLIVLALTQWGSRLLGMPRGDRIAAVFCGSKKTLASGVPMAHLIFGANPAIGLILLPIMIYHPLQLLAGGMLAQRWSSAEAAPS